MDDLDSPFYKPNFRGLFQNIIVNDERVESSTQDEWGQWFLNHAKIPNDFQYFLSIFHGVKLALADHKLLLQPLPSIVEHQLHFAIIYTSNIFY